MSKYVSVKHTDWYVIAKLNRAIRDHIPQALNYMQGCKQKFFQEGGERAKPSITVRVREGESFYPQVVCYILHLITMLAYTSLQQIIC